MIETRKPLRHFFALISFSFCFFVPLKAQTDKTLTLDQAIDLAYKNSGQIQTAAAHALAVTAKREQYWAAQMPNVTANAGYTRISDNITPYVFKFPGSSTETVLNPQILNQVNMRLGAQQTVYAGGRAINFYKSSEFLEKAAQSDVNKDRVDVKNQVENLFLNILKLERTKKILEENTTVITSRKNDAINFLKNGTGLENDVLKADLSLLQIKTTQTEVENSIQALKANLVYLLVLPDDTKLTLDDTGAVAESNTLLDLASYQKLIRSRPDFVSADYRKQSLESMLEVAKGNILPVIGVFAGIVNNSPNQRIFPQTDEFKMTWDAGVTLSYNITSLFTNKYQINEAKQNIEASKISLFGIESIAKGEVANAYYALQSANEKLALYKQAVTQTTENARVIKNRYNSQISTITESLDADFQALQAKINLENAILDTEIARRKLLKSVAK